MMEKKAYQETLPKKRISAGCLFFDDRGRLLVVNPTYKDTWEIPGGVVEENESPREAVIREVVEGMPPRATPVRGLFERNGHAHGKFTVYIFGTGVERPNDRHDQVT
jgi:ADP-ribose pyrophosphatase YjhB (NUDIX family)